MDPQAFADLIGDAASTFGLKMLGRATISRGYIDDFVAWEPVLRCLSTADPVYEPGSIVLRRPRGAPLDLHRSFTLDDTPDEIGHFSPRPGSSTSKACSPKRRCAPCRPTSTTPIAAPSSTTGSHGGHAPKTVTGTRARILGFNQKSPSLRELLRSERFRTISRLHRRRVRPTRSGRRRLGGRAVEEDRRRRGHLRRVSGTRTARWAGTAAGAAASRSGSRSPVPTQRERRARCRRRFTPRQRRAPRRRGPRPPRVPLPTRTGDVTVHCSCTLHMSRPPVSAERRVVYTGFGLAARPGDHRPERSQDTIRRERAALNDRVRATNTAPPPLRTASFDL